MNIFKKLLLIAATGMAAALAGCGDPMVVQQGQLGKIINNNGPEPEWRAPGTFRLDACYSTSCPRVVILETNRNTMTFEIDTVFLTKSNVDLTKVKVAVQFRVRPTKAAYDRVLAEVPLTSSKINGRVMWLTTEKLWEIYGRRAAPSAVVTTLRESNVDEILGNVPEIEKASLFAVQAELKDSPIEVLDLSYDGDIGELPTFVLEAKRQNYAVEDQKQRELKMLANSLAIEDQRQAVQRKRAANDAEIATSLGLSPGQYMCLKTMERLSDSSDKGVSVAIAFDCGMTVDANKIGKPTFLPTPAVKQ